MPRNWHEEPHPGVRSRAQSQTYVLTLGPLLPSSLVLDVHHTERLAFPRISHLQMERPTNHGTGIFSTQGFSLRSMSYSLPG